MTNSHTTKIVDTSDAWIGKFDSQSTGEWLDIAMLLVSSLIPFHCDVYITMNLTHTLSQSKISL